MKRGCHSHLAETAETAVMVVEAAVVVSVEVGARVSYPARQSPSINSCSVCRWPNTPKTL